MNNIIYDETSDYSMSDYYRVLKWLPRSKVDRQEPVFFESSIIVDGDSVVLPTIHEEFNGIDSVQVFMNCHGVDVDVSALTLGFSPLLNGNISFLTVNCTDTEINTDTDTYITFTLDDNVTFTDETREITGIKALKVDFGKIATNVEITKILFKSQNYTYTLSDIELFLITGKNHVLQKLGHHARHREIPKPLLEFVYMAGGAYAWLSRWEYETKPMKESKAEADNYATRLLNQVDNAVTEYIADKENKYSHHDLHHAIDSEIEWGF